jgi:ribonuclease P protein component
MSDRRGGMRRNRPRLTRSADFDRVYRHGRSAAVRSFVLYAFPSESADQDADEQRERVRLGVSVGRRVGGAVERNRVKRVLREAFWSLADELPSDYDFVILARGGAAERADRDGLDGVKEDLQELLAQLELSETAREGK